MGFAKMRAIAAIMTLLALGAAAVGGQRLREVMSAPDVAVGAPASAYAPAASDAAPAPPAPTRQWPALFGELAPPAPPEPPQPPAPEPEPEPQPPAPPKPPQPPVESLGYALKGVIRAGDSVWAMVSHPTGERIMRVGDELADGVTIIRIDEEGLWVDNGGDTLEMLQFPKQP